MPFLQEKIPDNQLYAQNILSNYALFSRRIEKYKGEEKERLLEYIKTNCELIVVITENLSEAFQFFDSQNARGKKLYPHDLLKAYHLREMRNIDAEETFDFAFFIQYPVGEGADMANTVFYGNAKFQFKGRA